MSIESRIKAKTGLLLLFFNWKWASYIVRGAKIKLGYCSHRTIGMPQKGTEISITQAHVKSEISIGACRESKQQ